MRRYHALDEPADGSPKLAAFMRDLRRHKGLPGGYPREDPRSSGRLTTKADAAGAPRSPRGSVESRGQSRLGSKRAGGSVF